jgi:Tol biopolymer transport system component
MDQTKMNAQVHPGFDGKIAFASNRDSNEEIYEMNVAVDIAQPRLTDNAVGSFAPTWSPEAMFGFFSNSFQ